MKNTKKVGKKSIIIAALALVLSGAVYINWLVSGGGMTLTDLVNGTVPERVLGNAELVNAPAGENAQTASEANTDQKPDRAGEAFTDLRITRTRTRDEGIAALKTVTEDDKLTADEKKSAVDTLTQLIGQMQSESNIENLVKAKGFTDCIAYVNGENVTVTVAVNEPLTASQAAQIKDIAIGETNYASECIKVVEVG